MFLVKLTVLIAVICCVGCNDIIPEKRQTVICLQRFEDFTHQDAKFVFENVRKVYPQTILDSAIKLPRLAFVEERNRYRPDSLIDFLKDRKGMDTISVGLINSDISTTTRNVKDWGVMGLGYQPGKSCIVSTFRLKKMNRNEQLLKVVWHEIGHTRGLAHCIEPTCLMRDAEGYNHLDEETDFCKKCRKILEKKGLTLVQIPTIEQ